MHSGLDRLCSYLPASCFGTGYSRPASFEVLPALVRRLEEQEACRSWQEAAR